MQVYKSYCELLTKGKICDTMITSKGSRTLPRGNVRTSSARQLEMPRCVRIIMYFQDFQCVRHAGSLFVLVFDVLSVCCGAQNTLSINFSIIF